MEHMSGKRILLTRAADDMSPWAERLSSLGAEGVSHPCISIERLQLASGWLRHLDECDWVAFTSFRSVAFFAELLGAKTLAKQLVAAVGPTTEAAVQARFGRCDLIAPDAVPAAAAIAWGGSRGGERGGSARAARRGRRRARRRARREHELSPVV